MTVTQLSGFGVITMPDIYKTLVETLPQKIFFKDCRSVYIYCNKNFAGDLNMEPDKILRYKEESAAFEDVKTELLGNMIKLIGRVTKNSMFDRLEFVANQVFTDVDPKEEIKRLEAEQAAKQ